VSLSPALFKPCGKQLLAVYAHDDRGGFAFLTYRLDLNLTDGRRLRVLSDGNESVLDPGPDLNAERWTRPFQERRFPAGWNDSISFRTSDWQKSQLCDNDSQNLRLGQFVDQVLPGGRVPHIKLG